MKSNHIVSRIWQVILVILPILASICFAIYVNKKPDEVSLIDYHVYKRLNLLGLPEEVKDGIEIKYNNDLIDNLSSLRFYIYNQTKKNFSNVEFHFELESSNEKTFTLISHSLSGPEGYPKKGIVLKDSKEQNIYIYKIDSLNRSPSDTYVEPFIAEFIFLSDDLPEISIGTPNIGLKMNDAKYIEWISDDFLTRVKYNIEFNNNRLIIGSAVLITFCIYVLIASKSTLNHFGKKINNLLLREKDKTLTSKKIETIVNEVMLLAKEIDSPKSLFLPIIRFFNKSQDDE